MSHLRYLTEPPITRGEPRARGFKLLERGETLTKRVSPSRSVRIPIRAREEYVKTPMPSPDPLRPWRYLYDSARWKRLRQTKLLRSPLCEHCLDSGGLRPAVQVHHRVKHGGDPRKFYCALDGLQALCDHCHNALMQAAEKTRFHAIGQDGFPLEEE